MNVEKEDVWQRGPKAVDNLILVGNLVLFLSLIAGVYLLTQSRECLQYCGNPKNHVINYLTVFWGIATIFGGWVQQQVINAFAEILRQLVAIRKNTARKID